MAFGLQRLNGVGDEADYENMPVVTPAKNTEYTVTKNDGTVLYDTDDASLSETTHQITVIPKGSKVTATGKASAHNKRISVKYDGKEGFANKEHLSELLNKFEFSWVSFGIGSAVGFVGALILRKLLK